MAPTAWSAPLPAQSPLPRCVCSPCQKMVVAPAWRPLSHDLKCSFHIPSSTHTPSPPPSFLLSPSFPSNHDLLFHPPSHRCIHPFIHPSAQGNDADGTSAYRNVDAHVRHRNILRYTSQGDEVYDENDGGDREAWGAREAGGGRTGDRGGAESDPINAADASGEGSGGGASSGGLMAEASRSNGSSPSS